MLFNGIVIGSLVVDQSGRVRGTAQISAPGLFDPEDPETARIIAEFTASVAELPAPMRQDDFALAESARASLRRAVGRRLQKRPLVDVHLMRIAD
jgi:ribonuclease J